MNEEFINNISDMDELYEMVQLMSNDELVNIINTYLQSHDLTGLFKEMINEDYLY